jgi:hypothetical protein
MPDRAGNDVQQQSSDQRACDKARRPVDATSVEGSETGRRERPAILMPTASNDTSSGSAARLRPDPVSRPPDSHREHRAAEPLAC